MVDLDAVEDLAASFAFEDRRRAANRFRLTSEDSFASQDDMVLSSPPVSPPPATSLPSSLSRRRSPSGSVSPSVSPYWAESPQPDANYGRAERATMEFYQKAWNYLYLDGGPYDSSDFGDTDADCVDSADEANATDDARRVGDVDSTGNADGGVHTGDANNADGAHQKGDLDNTGDMDNAHSMGNAGGGGDTGNVNDANRADDGNNVGNANRTGDANRAGNVDDMDHAANADGMEIAPPRPHPLSRHITHSHASTTEPATPPFLWDWKPLPASTPSSPQSSEREHEQAQDMSPKDNTCTEGSYSTLLIQVPRSPPVEPTVACPPPVGPACTHPAPAEQTVALPVEPAVVRPPPVEPAVARPPPVEPAVARPPPVEFTAPSRPPLQGYQKLHNVRTPAGNASLSSQPARWKDNQSLRALDSSWMLHVDQAPLPRPLGFSRSHVQTRSWTTPALPLPSPLSPLWTGNPLTALDSLEPRLLPLTPLTRPCMPDAAPPPLSPGPMSVDVSTPLLPVFRDSLHTPRTLSDWPMRAPMAGGSARTSHADLVDVYRN